MTSRNQKKKLRRRNRLSKLLLYGHKCFNILFFFSVLNRVRLFIISHQQLEKQNMNILNGVLHLKDFFKSGNLYFSIVCFNCTLQKNICSFALFKPHILNGFVVIINPKMKDLKIKIP